MVQLDFFIFFVTGKSSKTVENVYGLTVKQNPSLIIALYIHQVILQKMASEIQRSRASERQFHVYGIDSKPVLRAFSVHIVNIFFLHNSKFKKVYVEKK